MNPSLPRLALARCLFVKLDCSPVFYSCFLNFYPVPVPYDGSACAALGLAVTSVRFHYHMYGSDMGTLKLVDAAGQAVWSMSGNQGNAWKEASVPNVFSPSFAFEYTRGAGFTGDAAVGQVRRRLCVACDAPYLRVV